MDEYPPSLPTRLHTALCHRHRHRAPTKKHVIFSPFPSPLSHYCFFHVSDFIFFLRVVDYPSALPNSTYSHVSQRHRHPDTTKKHLFFTPISPLQPPYNF